MLKKVKWALAFAAIPVVLGYLGCVDNTDIPELAGPSELAASLQMSADPDQLTADGWSSSVIEVVYRDENGQRRSGQTIVFDLGARSDVVASGPFSAIGDLAELNAPRPVAGGNESHTVKVVTDGDGVARAKYWAPFRTDQVNDTTVTVTSRPEGTDFRSAFFRQVDIFLRAADRPSFPGQNQCAIIVEPQKGTYAVNEQIFFTAAQLTGDVSVDGCAGNPIARYEWDFGDGTKPPPNRGVSHTYDSQNTYTVTLFTTEQGTGCQTSCTEEIVVTNTGAPPPPEPPPPEPCASPSASFLASQICATGEILTDGTLTFLDASLSTGGTGASITSYGWSLGNGATGSGQIISVAYGPSLNGLTITVTLVVTNDCGNTASTSQSFDVVPVCP